MYPFGSNFGIGGFQSPVTLTPLAASPPRQSIADIYPVFTAPTFPNARSYFGMNNPTPRTPRFLNIRPGGTGPRPIMEDIAEMDCAANLLEEINKKVLVQLRDGRSIIGVLRSVDEFSNITLTQAVERIHVGKDFGEIYRGVVMIRGDNLVLVGEIDDEKQYTSQLRKVPFADILSMQKDICNGIEVRDKNRSEGFKERGLHYMPRHKDEMTMLRLGDDQFN